MSITINNTSAYERETDENWAAAYAKRLTEQEVANRNTAIAAAIEIEEGKRVSAENAITDGTALEDKCIKTRHINPGNVTSGCIHDGDVTAAKIATGAVTRDKLYGDVFAGIEETGYGDTYDKAVTPFGLKRAIGDIIPAHVTYGDFGITNIPMDSINKDVTSIFGNPVRDAGLREYSTSPTRVGTWIDGTPIWRVAINKVLSAADFTAGYYQFTNNDLGVLDKSSISLILNNCLRHYYPNSNAEDSVPLQIGDSYKLTLSGDTEYVMLRGFVEFATPATNIITE